MISAQNFVQLSVEVTEGLVGNMRRAGALLVRIDLPVLGLRLDDYIRSSLTNVPCGEWKSRAQIESWSTRRWNENNALRATWKEAGFGCLSHARSCGFRQSEVFSRVGDNGWTKFYVLAEVKQRVERLAPFKRNTLTLCAGNFG